MSYFLKEDLISSALNAAEGAVYGVLGLSKRPDENRFVHVAVLYQESYKAHRPIERCMRQTFGKAPEKRGDWKRSYDAYAYSKASLANEHKMNTSQLVNEQPALMNEGDIIYAGGVWLHGIAVGVSGIESQLDETIAKIVAELIHAAILMELTVFQATGKAHLQN